MNRSLRPLLLVLVAASIALASMLLGSAPAQAQTAPTTTIVPLDDQPLQSPSIIPEPNTASQPTQYIVMAAIVVGLGVIVFLVRRDSQRNKGNRTHTPA